MWLLRSTTLCIFAVAMISIVHAKLMPTFQTREGDAVYASPVSFAIEPNSTVDKILPLARKEFASSRIIGGYTVDATNREWMVGILFVDQTTGYATICGGSYIGSNNNYHAILTAAHCIVGDFTYAAAFFNFDSAYAETIKSDEYYLSQYTSKRYHASYDPSTIQNDIGILTFYDTTFSGPSTPILASSDLNLVVGETLTVTGYGITSYATQSMDGLLREVKVNLISDSSCATQFNTVGIPTDLDLQVCTYNYKKGSCSGDSGGPLVATRAGEEIVMGIVSWGIECADTASYPDVYTRVSTYESWIKSNVAAATGSSSFLKFYDSSTPTASPTTPTIPPTAPTTSPTSPTTAPVANTASPTAPTTSPVASTASPTVSPTSPTASPTEFTTSPTPTTISPTTITDSPTTPSSASPTVSTTAPTSIEVITIAPTENPTLPPVEFPFPFTPSPASRISAFTFATGMFVALVMINLD